MRNSRLSFWRDEAGLDLFSSEKRWKAYWIIPLSIIISISGIGVTIYKTSQDWTVLPAIGAMLAYPVCFIIEMYTKGGDAGSRLMGSGPIELYQVQQHFDNLCEWMKTPGRKLVNPEEFKCRISEMVFDLFGFPANFPDASDAAKFLQASVIVVEPLRPVLTVGGYNKDWRPKRWNDDIKDDLIRERKYDPLLTPAN